MLIEVYSAGIDDVIRSVPSGFQQAASSTNSNSQGQGFILIYSITSRYTFEDVVNYCKQVRRVKRKTFNDNVVFALVGNKCDLSNKREVSVEEGEALALQLDCQFFETSAKTGQNIGFVVQNLVKALRQAPGESFTNDCSSGLQVVWDCFRCTY